MPRESQAAVQISVPILGDFSHTGCICNNVPGARAHPGGAAIANSSLGLGFSICWNALSPPSPLGSVSGDCFSRLITLNITGEPGISVVSSLWVMHLHAEFAPYSSPISQISSCSFLLQRALLKIPPSFHQNVTEAVNGWGPVLFFTCMPILGKFFSSCLGCGVGPCGISGEAAALLSFHLTKLTPVHTMFQSVLSAQKNICRLWHGYR